MGPRKAEEPLYSSTYLSFASRLYGPQRSSKRKRRTMQAAPIHSLARFFHLFKEGLGQPGGGGLLPKEVFQSLPPSGVSKDKTEPCLVFDQIWWYLSRSSCPNQLLSYAVETCPTQINLVTFRSLSSPLWFLQMAKTGPQQDRMRHSPDYSPPFPPTPFPPPRECIWCLLPFRWLSPQSDWP